MGSSQDLQNRRKRRNSDCISNYVDRVRICDTKSIESESIYSKVNSQKTGWRQKSLSNIDLSLSNKEFQPGAGAFRYRDFEAHDDFCIKNIKNNKNIEIQRDYEDICNVNPKAQGQKRDIIQEHNKLHVNSREKETCSLRRSKSLAVIREETFNDLAITGANKRRSQLIPRAKLIDRSFFKDRISFPLDESFNCSSSCLNATIDNVKEGKKLNSHYYSWQYDRSDLESIDSSIFKNSLHQNSLEKSNSLRSESTKIISRAEIHKNDDNDDDVQKTFNADEILKDGNDTLTSININEDTESGITIIEIKDRHDKGSSSVISYDSIYLSSESDQDTVVNEGKVKNIHTDIDSKIKDFEEIIRELKVVNGSVGGESEKAGAESIIDNLYSQVGKGLGKADVKTAQAKITLDTLNKYSDYISKGTVESLTRFVADGIENDKKTLKINEHNKSVFQYSSLPNADISKLLRDCELIDAKLRDDVSVELSEPYPDYDSVSNDVNELLATKKQEDDTRKSSEVKRDSTKRETISIDENPKGAPSIELVQLPTKEIIDNSNSSDLRDRNHTTKIYLPDIGVEFDYENSIVSFETESDSDIESPTQKPPIFNLVTITGRKVYVDELAAKVEQQKDKATTQSEVNKKSDVSVDAISKNCPNEIVQKIIIATGDKQDEIKVTKGKQDLVDCTDKKHLAHSKANVKDKDKTKKTKTTKVQLQQCQADNCEKSFHLVRERNYHSFNMPRPQLLSIIDSKNSIPKKDHPKQQHKNIDVKVENKNERVINQTEREFLHKVDSVRNYWSKILNNENSISNNGNLKQMSTKSSSDIPDSLKDEEFQSFFPTVEIVELNGDTQAALVTSRKLNEVEFDHVRYKVMKSDMFQKNVLGGNRKETQFDGLMQYLQDYSFQELLANNNVVIIEPVRTKIEKITEQPAKAQSASCKITNGAINKNNLKKHFFYHPIRVNKELYEEELPVPDTVRNVRKLFEGSLRRTTTSPSRENNSKISESNDNLRRKTIRYLTIDTSFDGSNNLGVSKWDSISLSSGVSSAADLNSPCECQESSSNKEINFVCSSKDNLTSEDNEDYDSELKSSFVTADIMEKIRECGSSITYYGGQTIEKNKKSEVLSKPIVKEINGTKCNCHSRRSSRSNDKYSRKTSNDYSGMKFKLVKSNSCSSRLELTGTCLEKNAEEIQNMIHDHDDNDTDDNNKELDEHEETVKEMVNRLESKHSIIPPTPTKPRIIESKCIEKANKDFIPKLTINHQSFDKVPQINENVSVNNHLNSGSRNATQDDTETNISKPKVVRNKNVDLAMASVMWRNEQNVKLNSMSVDMENLATREELSHAKDAKWSNICKMDSVEMVKNQDKINNCAHIKSRHQHHPHDEKEQTVKSTQINNSHGDEKSIKMVNWSTVGSSLGKEYIANDRNLVQTRIYDEMEFEEFEVMGEQYDSLNSK